MSQAACRIRKGRLPLSDTVKLPVAGAPCSRQTSTLGDESLQPEISCDVGRRLDFGGAAVDPSGTPKDWHEAPSLPYSGHLRLNSWHKKIFGDAMTCAYCRDYRSDHQAGPMSSSTRSPATRALPTSPAAISTRTADSPCHLETVWIPSRNRGLISRCSGYMTSGARHCSEYRKWEEDSDAH